MKKMIVTGITIFLSLGFTLIIHAAGDAAKGKTLYPVCIACHGLNGEGNAALHAPAIGGQGAWYIARQLKNFKSGIRGTHPKDVYGAQMRPMSMILTNDQAVEDVAAYVATLKPSKPASSVKGNAAAGKAMYAVCLACHGANGEGNKALNAPRLAGQHDWYTVQQIKNFKAGIRGTNAKDMFGAQMRPMSMMLATDDIINNVSAYISTLK